MQKNQTYRIITSCFLASLVGLVFILQGLHHLVGHHHDEEICSYSDVHIHDESHAHISCSICFFHFQPTELDDFELSIIAPQIHSTQLLFCNSESHFTQKLRQSYLRGPPFILS